jgi:hypothetical protein
MTHLGAMLTDSHVGLPVQRGPSGWLRGITAEASGSEIDDDSVARRVYTHNLSRSAPIVTVIPTRTPSRNTHVTSVLPFDERCSSYTGDDRSAGTEHRGDWPAESVGEPRREIDTQTADGDAVEQGQAAAAWGGS